MGSTHDVERVWVHYGDCGCSVGEREEPEVTPWWRVLGLDNPEKEGLSRVTLTRLASRVYELSNK